MSNGAKSRLAAKEVGTLTFDINVPETGIYALAVEYTDIGFEAVPRLFVAGLPVDGSVGPVELDPERAAMAARDLGTRSSGEHVVLRAEAELTAGMNTIEVRGGEYALDVDYLEVTPGGM